MNYRVANGLITVHAHSSVHDKRTTWNRVTGEIAADPETLATQGATGRFDVDMTAFDAGDFLSNRKLRKDFDLEAHPRARFELRRVHSVERKGARFTATAEGVLDWRGHKLDIVLAGEGMLDDKAAQARASFALDIRKLGLSAPRFLMFKMEDEVTVEVALSAQVAA